MRKRGKLTAKEEQVLRLLLAGAQSKEIAIHLGKHHSTIDAQRASVQAKLQSLSPVHLGYIAAKMGLEPDTSIVLAHDVANSPIHAPELKHLPRGAGRSIGRDL